jgi:glycosyltransferase involved in cell wall biosynthesis
MIFTYSLDVIVPFYNEERYLKQSVERLLRAKIHNKIYLVNNNSTDSSINIAKKFASESQDIEYIETSSQAGKGVAIREAIPYLNGTHVVIHDADLEYFPDDIIEMKRISQENIDTMMIGSRFIGNKTRENNYKRTIAANKLLSFFFSIVHSQKISDIATCYKLLPTNILKEIELKEDGFAIEVEITAKFLKATNSKILEVPIKYEGRTYAEGKKITTLDGLKYIFASLIYK